MKTTGPKQERPPHFGHHGQGYEMWTTKYDYVQLHVYVHRLAAVAWFGFDEVVDKDVHHINNIPWDNRESNVDVLDHDAHARRHSNERMQDRDTRYHDRDWLLEQYVDKGHSMAAIGDMCDVADETIRTWMGRYNIESRSVPGGPNVRGGDE